MVTRKYWVNYCFILQYGFISGFDISATSGSTTAIDYMKVTAALKLKSGTLSTSDYDYNTSGISTSLYTSAGFGEAVLTGTYKSTHVFKNAGYANTTKIVTRNK